MKKLQRSRRRYKGWWVTEVQRFKVKHGEIESDRVIADAVPWRGETRLTLECNDFSTFSIRGMGCHLISTPHCMIDCSE